MLDEWHNAFSIRRSPEDFTTQHILLTSLGKLAQPQCGAIRKIDCDDITYIYRLAMHTMHPEYTILMMMLGSNGHSKLIPYYILTMRFTIMGKST